MKSLIRLGITTSLIATTIAGTMFSETLKAFAIPEEDILQKLRPIPVFTVADQEGAPLVASGTDDSKVAGVFISESDAKDFVEDLKQKDPALAEQVRVVPVSLGEIYQLSQESEADPNGIKFAYVPINEEVEKAQEVLSQSGQEYQGGVPLFVAKAGEEQGYLTIERNNEQVIPFFFEKSQLQNMLSRFEEQQPELASTIVVEVIPLEVILATLETSEDEVLRKIVFVPTEESIDFLRSTQGTPENAPAPQE